jgi:RimJ/RimL family protein N-acetyltransferase
MGAVLVVASVTVENAASVRVLEKVGLGRVGEPIYLPKQKEWSVKYALTKDQFDQQQGREP